MLCAKGRCRSWVTPGRATAAPQSSKEAVLAPPFILPGEAAAPPQSGKWRLLAVCMLWERQPLENKTLKSLTPRGAEIRGLHLPARRRYLP